MAGGRPTDYRPEYCQQIVDFMSDGSHVIQFAAHVGVAKSTVYKWAEDNAEFSDALKRANSVSTAAWLKQYQLRAFGITKDGSDALLIHMLKKKDRYEFGDENPEKKIEDTGANILDKLSSETLSAMAKDVANAK